MHRTRLRQTLLAAALSSLLLLPAASAAEPPPAPAPADTPALRSAPAPAEFPDTPAGRTARTFFTAFSDPKAPQLTEKNFTPEFLAQVPFAKFTGLLTTMRTQLGALTLHRIEPGATDTKLIAIARAENGGSFFRVPISTDDQGVINGLLISPAPAEGLPPLKSWDDLDDQLEPLAESVSVAAYSFAPTGGKWPPMLLVEPIHQLNADEPMAVGSTFKLYVLLALAAKIDRGDATWDTKLAIDDRLKSLPSGVMQNDKAGAEFPLKHFALKMISISDNTATDHLMHFVGRKAIESVFHTPAFEKFGSLVWNPKDASFPISASRDKTLPFLSTREMFAIKLAQDRTLVERYAIASLPERRALLAPAGPEPDSKPGEVAATQPSIAMAAFWLKPVAIDRVEWFVSARNACEAMITLDLMSQSRDGKLAELNTILGANPGVPLNPKVWKRFFYKGGSEPGVLNLTWLLERADGRTFVLSMTLNDTNKAIKDDQPIALAVRAIELLAAHQDSPPPKPPTPAPAEHK